tara:strand:+ start:486 stop:1175 length:690 start_codon:yes stop_codon:yes gene_type:complete
VTNIIVAHQPQYFPYLGIYNKILKSNNFVILDDVQFKNSAWHARTIIKNHEDNIIQLTIPCSKTKSSSKNIKEIQIADNKWKIKHLKIIENVYKNTKNFNDIYKIIYDVISIKSNYLVDYTIPSVIKFLDKLDYPRDKIFIQSEERAIIGTKNDFLINLTKRFNGDIYLSGTGGENYIDEKKFLDNKIDHKFNDFKHPLYYQVGGEFIPKLSIIDAAFNIGIKELKILI